MYQDLLRFLKLNNIQKVKITSEEMIDLKDKGIPVYQDPKNESFFYNKQVEYSQEELDIALKLKQAKDIHVIKNIVLIYAIVTASFIGLFLLLLILSIITMSIIGNI